MGFRYNIRPATPDDCGDVVRLIGLHAELEGANVKRDVKMTELQLKEDCFGDGAYIHLLVVDACEDDNTSCADKVSTIVGIALYYFAYSSWVGRIVFVEELYIEPLHRGKGLGKSIMCRIAQTGHDKGCKGLQWVANENNQNALEFYARLGSITGECWKLMYARGDNFVNIVRLDLTNYKSNIQVL